MKNVKFLFLTGVLLVSVCGFSLLKANKEEAKAGEVVVLDKAEFIKRVYNYNEQNGDKWVYKGSKPCIVDFYADWCAPCKKIAPILKELAAEYKDDIVVYKVNVDDEKELAAAFGVKSIPTLLFISTKGEPYQALGSQPKESFVKLIESHLLNR
jgi:thioredoxin